jgi:hypothetical protein
MHIVIWSGEIRVRWKKLVLKREQTNSGLNGARGAQRMTHHAFG